MGVYINSTRFENRFDGAAPNWLLANVGDYVKITHSISVKTFTLSSTNLPFIFGNTDGYLPISGTMWVTGGDFSEFNVGDEVQVYDYSTNTLEVPSAMIVEKLSSSEIRLDDNPMGWTNASGTAKAISRIDDIRALRYKFNLIENDEATNFFSKVDGSEFMVEATGIDATNTTTINTMTFLGAKDYQIGEVTVKGMGVSTSPVYESKFRVTHLTRVTPFMLASQWDDILNGVKPSYFENLNCLKPAFYFFASEAVNNPNNLQEIQSDETLGNTGYFNENFNARKTKYSISNLVLEDNSGTSAIILPSVLMSVTDFSFEINNTTTNPFSAGNTVLELHFAKAPNSEEEYQNKGRDLRHNFVWETCLLTANTAPSTVNGDNYSDTSLRSLKGCKAVVNSSSKITVTGSLSFEPSSISVFNESDEPRYMFWVSVKNHSLGGNDSDLVSLLVDSAPFYYQTDFPTLLDITSKIIPHDVENYTDSFTLRDVFVEDELVGFSEIEIVEDEKHLTNSKSFIRFTGKVVAINTVTNEEFTLESNSINVANTPVINGFQYFNVQQARAFHVPSNEIRKNIKAWFDTATSKYYFAYPFINRWEYWEKLQGVSSSFFNTSQPNDGFNHNWQHYNTGNWKLSYVTEIAMKVNNTPAIYTSYNNFDCFDENLSNTFANNSCVISTYDPDTLTELKQGAKKFILGYKNTLVKALFTNDLSVVEPTDVVVIGLEIFEEGGVNGKRRMSSKYVSDADTWFIPLTGETKVKVNNLSDEHLEASVLIDFTKLNLSKNKYRLTARVYGIDTLSGSSLPHLKYAMNYLCDQLVYLIKDNPVTEDVTVVDEKLLDCESDFVWKVLADASNNNELRNDKNSFIFSFDKDAIEDAKIYLTNSDGLDVLLEANTTYGTPYGFGFFENNQNEKLVGYLIDWRSVLIENGECVYKIRCDYTTSFGSTGSLYSKSFCLKQYTDFRAENTVRIEYYQNGILGVNENDKKVRDYGTLNWYNQYRFNGIFHYTNSAYKIDEIVYNNGNIVTVEDEQTPEYLLNLKPTPFFKHEILRTDILQSDEILITDYNSKNIEKYYKKSVKKVGDFAPKLVPYRSKLAGVEIKFKQAFNNLRKFIS